MLQTGSGDQRSGRFKVKKNEMGCLPGPGTALLGRRDGVKGVDTMRLGRYMVVLAGVGVLAAGCGTKAQPDNLTAAVTRTAGQTARASTGRGRALSLRRSHTCSSSGPNGTRCSTCTI
jgi:hypothetical protein